MTPNRKLVCDFLDLPTHVQFEIARELGLSLTDSIPQADNTDLFTLWLREAKERGQLEQFRTLVERNTD